MLFLTLFFEVRLVARTRFGHAIPSLPLSLPHIHSHRQTLARTGSNWPSFSLKYLCKFSFVHNLFNLSSHSLTHIHTQCQWKQKKKANKNIERSLRVDRTHIHTLAFTDTVTHATFITSFVLGLTFATRRRRRNDDDDDTNARERS